ncbi:MAG: hypothetical protein H8D45_20290 [Bacteroidetes bacterium]|nr:hypothetical protein [Bacteroidota bacterium]MBC8488373.1 hypothetical protein [Bacteroidota bacterium]
MLTLKDRIKNFLIENPDILTAQGQGSLEPLFEKFGNETNRKYLSKVKNEAILEYEQGTLEKVAGLTIRPTTEEATETATEGATEDSTFSKDEVEKLKELLKPGKRSSYGIIYKIRSWNDTEPRSIRLSLKLLEQAKKKAKKQGLTLQEFINLIIYNEVNK